MVQSASKPGDGVAAYFRGIEEARSWDSETRRQLQTAVANNPYAVWADVRSELLGQHSTPSRQHMLRTGGTTDHIGRGPVIDNMHKAAWGAIFGAAGMRHSTETLLAVVTEAGRNRDEAFQPATGSWTNSNGETVTGPVFTWDRWNGKEWVKDR